MNDMFLLKDDGFGPIYLRIAAIGSIRVIPNNLREAAHPDQQVEIRYLSGSRDWITDADWARIKPLVVMEGQSTWLSVQPDTVEAEILQQPADTPVPLQTSAPTTFEAEMQASEKTPQISGEISPQKPTPVPSAPLRSIVRVKCGTFYSTTSRSNRAQWTGYTDDGVIINLFDHGDPLRDHKPKLDKAGYLAFFQTMAVGETAYWKSNPIRVTVKPNGKFWDLVSIEPRDTEAMPDEPTEAVELSPVQLAVCREAKALLEAGPVIFDCETTGLGDDDEIVEIAGVDATGRVLFAELVKPTDMSKLRRPGKRGKTSVDIHGIDEDMVTETHQIGDEEGQVGWIFKTYFHGKVWSAFNIDYDARLMRQSWDLAGCLPDGFPLAEKRVCVQQLMNRYVGHDYTSVDEACRVLGIQRRESHRALADALDTVKVLQALAAKVPADELPF